MDASNSEQTQTHPSRFKSLTEGLFFTRAMLRNFFDEWVVQSGVNDACPGFLYAVASGLDKGDNTFNPAVDQDALALALAALPEDAHVLGFMGAAIAAGIFDRPNLDETKTEAARTGLMERVVDLVGHDVVAEVLPNAVAQDGLTANAEAHDPLVTWTETGKVLPAILKARRRICRIGGFDHAGDEVNLGSGFLIGPSAVLTNQHVVEGVSTGKVTEDKLFCVFEFSDTTGLQKNEAARHVADDHWHIASSPIGREMPEGAQVDWWADETIREAFLEDMADKLDYAVIRLETSPGLQRGWYDLENLPRGVPKRAIAIHHPVGLNQSISMGNMDFSGRKDVRLFHKADTAKGSSGALLMNQIGEPIGLHHVGIDWKKDNKKQFMNVAISLKHISTDLKNKAVFEDIRKSAQIAPPLGCVDGTHPLFGRTDLLEKLQQMWDDPKKRILMIHYEPKDRIVEKPGKSFTTEIIKGLFRFPENHHIVFRAGETQADAFEFVSATIKNFSNDFAADPPSGPQTTTAAHVQNLVDFLVKKMKERLPNEAVWLIIDDLEHHRLSDGSGREYLATIYSEIEKIAGLRVVLIGLTRNTSISGLDSSNLLRSDITDDDLSAFDELFAKWFLQRSAMGEQVDGNAVRLLASTMGSYAKQKAPLKAMSEFVVKHMSNAAVEIFDGGSTSDDNQ